MQLYDKIMMGQGNVHIEDWNIFSDLTHLPWSGTGERERRKGMNQILRCERFREVAGGPCNGDAGMKAKRRMSPPWHTWAFCFISHPDDITDERPSWQEVLKLWFGGLQCICRRVGCKQSLQEE